MNIRTTDRRYELDWLRLAGTMVVFFYHSSRFFNVEDWHIKNANTYTWVEALDVFVTSWMMPLFFIISGAGLFYTVGNPTRKGRFYSDKFLRLMVPVLVASLTHGALQMYLDRLTHGQFSGSFFTFVPEYFNGLFLNIGMPGNFAFQGIHLWYLFFLFLYSTILYRMFLWLKGRGARLLKRMSGLSVKSGVMYLLFPLPLIATKGLIPHAVLNFGAGGWGFLYYISFLISGFVIASNVRLQRRIEQQRWLSLILAVAASSAYLYLLFGNAGGAVPTGIFGWLSTLLKFFSAWCWLFAFWGLGRRFLSADRVGLGEANESILPFYILHQPVLLCVGYFIIPRDIHDTLKWALIAAISFAFIASCCALLIRKIDLLRFLCGMKTTRPLFKLFRNKGILILLHVLYIGLVIFAVAFQRTGDVDSGLPPSLMYDPEHDILLTDKSVTAQSNTGVRIINDRDAFGHRAIEFLAGANLRPEPHPEVFVEMRFSAPAGQYMIWVRGKSNVDDVYTDSFWLQLKDQIETKQPSSPLGNWLEIHPVGIYGWASDTKRPVFLELPATGEHTIRIQPRQVPHRVDQIWLSRTQYRIPNTRSAITP